MKHLTLFFLLIISSSYSFGQYSNCYYWLTSKASLANQQQAYEESALLYTQAFEDVEKALMYDYLSAAHANAKVGNKEKALEYLKEAAIAGVEWEAVQYYEKGFLEVFGEEEYEQIGVDFEEWRKEFYKGLNLSVYTQLVQMDATDQYIRRQVFNFPDATTHKYLTTVDSINTHNLKQLVEKEGFPKIREIGHNGMYNAIIIIVHAVQNNESDWNYFEPILKAEISKGNIRPIDYATIADAWHVRLYQKSLYGISLAGRNKLKEIENIGEVDDRRLEIGLAPLKYSMEERGIKEIPEDYEWKGDDYLKECLPKSVAATKEQNQIQSQSSTEVNYFTDYYPLINQAELSNIDSNYQAALKHYQTAFEKQEPLRFDLVEAAKLAVKLKDKDLAVSYLLKAFGKGTALEFIQAQEDFEGFQDSHWQTLKEEYPKIHQAFSSKVNHELKKEIAKMEEVDQKYRQDTELYNENFETQNRLDSIQAVRLIQIIEKYGWLSEQLTGINENQQKYKNGHPSYFIILLHCHTAFRKDYFIPILTEKAKQGLCPPRLAALLVDQTALYSGELQKYGTYRCKNEDVRMPCRLADEEKVNEWRASIGLESFEDHLKKTGMEYTWKPLEGEETEKSNK